MHNHSGKGELIVLGLNNKVTRRPSPLLLRISKTIGMCMFSLITDSWHQVFKNYCVLVTLQQCWVNTFTWTSSEGSVIDMEIVVLKPQMIAKTAELDFQLVLAATIPRKVWELKLWVQIVLFDCALSPDLISLTSDHASGSVSRAAVKFLILDQWALLHRWV